MILNLLYQGLIIVLLLTFSFGPAFFALINIGIKSGYKAGSMLALGVVLSDLLLCIGICILVYFGSENLLQSEKAQNISALIGGIILILFGAAYFFKKSAATNSTIEIEKVPSRIRLIVKGFLLNLFNPSVWFLWLANVATIGKTLSYSLPKMVIFFLITLGAVLGIELGKVYLAEKIKHYLTPRMMHITNYVTGAALIIFGVVLIYQHYFAH